MANYNISRRPLTMDRFVEIAKSKGWSLAAKDPDQPSDDINLVDAGGRIIVAYPQPTIFKDHIGFMGGVYGLLELWQQSLEQRILEDYGLDEDLEPGEAIEALDEVLFYYDEEPVEAVEVRRELSAIGEGEA